MSYRLLGNSRPPVCRGDGLLCLIRSPCSESQLGRVLRAHRRARPCTWVSGGDSESTSGAGHVGGGVRVLTPRWRSTPAGGWRCQAEFADGGDHSLQPHLCLRGSGDASAEKAERCSFSAGFQDRQQAAFPWVLSSRLRAVSRSPYCPGAAVLRTRV